MPRENLDVLRAQLGQEVRALQTAVDALDEAVAVHLGVNRTDLRCLDVLMQRDGVAPSQLSTALGLTTGSVTAMLDRLEKIGYLTRSPDPIDRRKVVVRATPQVAAKAYEIFGPLVEDGNREIAHYTREELELLVDFVRRSRAIQERQLANVRGLPSADHQRKGATRT
jgi:DNA-binding MarR family transcriptional regulator